MGMQKWQALDHICDAIRVMGDRTYLHVGRFESCHILFKKAFYFSSKKVETVMNEDIDKANRQLKVCFHNREAPDSYQIANASRLKARGTDGAYLFNTGPNVILEGIERNLYQNKLPAGHSVAKSSHICFERQLLERVKSECLCSFSRLRHEYFHTEYIDLDKAFHNKDKSSFICFYIRSQRTVS